MDKDEILVRRREAILVAATKYGARNVRLFGSVARGEAGPGSDVDFLVTLEPGRSLLDHAGLILELEDMLGLRVDVATERGMKPAVRERALREAIPL